MLDDVIEYFFHSRPFQLLQEKDSIKSYSLHCSKLIIFILRVILQQYEGTVMGEEDGKSVREIKEAGGEDENDDDDDDDDDDGDEKEEENDKDEDEDGDGDGDGDESEEDGDWDWDVDENEDKNKNLGKIRMEKDTDMLNKGKQ